MRLRLRLTAPPDGLPASPAAANGSTVTVPAEVGEPDETAAVPTAAAPALELEFPRSEVDSLRLPRPRPASDPPGDA